MSGNRKNVNSKAEAGRAKKAENAAKKQAKLEEHKEAAVAAEWSVGSNAKRVSREEEAARKADEAARRRREKAELLAAEEQALGNAGASKAKKAVQNAKKSIKKKDDLSLLEASLQSAADKKVRAKKEQQQAAEAAQKSKASSVTSTQAQQLDPLLANTAAMIGVDGDEDSLFDGRQANVERMKEVADSGIDAALQNLNLSAGGATANSTISKNLKALYLEFEERTLPQVKAEYPGLRLSQYKEKVWALWKKAPENPANALSMEK